MTPASMIGSYFKNSRQFSIGSLTISNVTGNQYSYRDGPAGPSQAAGEIDEDFEFICRPITISEQLLKDIATSISMPFLARSRESILRSLKLLSGTEENRELLTDLVAMSVQVLATIDTYYSGGGCPLQQIIEKLEQLFKDVETCVQEEGQRSWMSYVVFSSGVAHRTATLERHLHEVFVDFDICQLISMRDLADRTSSTRLSDWRKNDHERLQAVKAIRSITREDIRSLKPLRSGRGFEVYVAEHDNRRVVMKEFHGPRAKDHMQQVITFSHSVLHPRFLDLKAISLANSAPYFVVFDNCCSVSAELKVASALLEDQTRSIQLGLNIVGGLSAGLGYLFRRGIPSNSSLEEQLEIYITDDDQFKIGFAPHVGVTEEMDDVEQEEDNRWNILNKLCLKIFKQANSLLHREEKLELERPKTNSIVETLENPSTRESSRIPGSSVSDPPNAPVDSETPVKPRRELVWTVPSEGSLTVDLVAQHYQDYLDTMTITRTGSLTLRKLHARTEASRFKPRHRCPGYRKEEITLTTSIAENAIISHSTPFLNEICSVCNEVVEEGVFNCICGLEDNGISPTVKCSQCFVWQHRDCGTPVTNFRNFRCMSCANSNNRFQSGMYPMASSVQIPMQAHPPPHPGLPITQQPPRPPSVSSFQQPPVPDLRPPPPPRYASKSGAAVQNPTGSSTPHLNPATAAPHNPNTSQTTQQPHPQPAGSGQIQLTPQQKQLFQQRYRQQFLAQAAAKAGRATLGGPEMPTPVHPQMKQSHQNDL